MVRIDYNITPSFQVYWRYVQDKDEQQVPYGMWVNGNVNIGIAPITFGQPGKGHVFHMTKSISLPLSTSSSSARATTSCIFTRRMRPQSIAPRWGIPRSGSGFQQRRELLGQNKLHAEHRIRRPAIQHGQHEFGNIPYENFNTIMSFVDNISKVQARTRSKPACILSTREKFQVGGTNPRGTFNFSPNSNNPFDSGDSFANALIGQLNTYSEATPRVNGDWYFNNLEFYVQDNWRISRG